MAAFRLGSITVIIRILLGSVFMLAALSKGTDITAFSRKIASTLESVSPTASVDHITWFLAIFLIITEFIIGFGTATGFGFKYFIRLYTGYLFIFILFVAIELLQGNNNSCGCFGALISRTAIWSLVENIIFLVLAILLFLSHRINKPLNKWCPFRWAIIISIWSVVFYLVPPPWAVAREGMRWDRFEINVHDGSLNDAVIWLLEPNCSQCLEHTDHINDLHKHTNRVTALSASTPGRIEEYRYDFNPEFPILRIDNKDWNELGLSAGNLIIIERGIIKQIKYPDLSGTD